MPRPKSIPWHERVRIFVDFRKSGKILPTAKLHHVARSTVSAIVSEFEEDGFSRGPRSNLPPNMLREMQDRHLNEILRSIQGSDGQDIVGFQIGSLNLGPGTDDDEGRLAAEKEPLRVSEEILWHLKGTKAEEVIQVARGAARDYLQRDREAWAKLHRTLEEVCGLEEREDTSTSGREPYILPALIRKLRRAFVEADFRRQPPGADWLQWDVSAEDPLFLKLRNEPVAVGNTGEHSQVKRAVETFLNEGFREHQSRFNELERLRQELQLLGQIKNETLDKIDESDVRRAICPACPYPEATADVQTEPQIDEETN